MSDMVWIELDASFRFPVRIFKSRQAAMRCPNRIDYWDRALAVKLIRTSIFVRSKGFCELCGDLVTEQSGQMHEQKHRGKGGEISLENSVFICAKTHRREHRDRNPRFSSSKPPDKGGFVTQNSKAANVVGKRLTYQNLIEEKR